MAPAVVGKSVPRQDAMQKVTGSAVYGYDFEVPMMLYGKILRSPYPHARIIKVDVSEAEKVSGVEAVITYKDTGGRLRGTGLNDMPTLANDRVRYVGEPVAAIAAKDNRTAWTAAKRIRVEYEPLPLLLDPEEAAGTSPPTVLHPRLYEYGGAYAFGPKPDKSRPNVCAVMRIVNGDVKRGFDQADVIVENKFTTSMVQHAQMEPISSVTKWEPDGSLPVWEPTQSPFRVRQELSYALGIPTSQVRVIAPYMGGGYGIKLQTHASPVCALLSKKTGRPVKIILSRDENFSSTLIRHPFIIKIKDGVKKDGTLIGREMSMILDGGAYSGGSGVHVTRICALSAVAAYRIPNIKIESLRVYTNHVPGGAFRGFGAQQAIWAIESQMDAIAERLGIDPIEFRLRNLHEEGDSTAIGERLTSISYREALLRVAEEMHLKEVQASQGPWRRGKGIALLFKPSHAPTASSAMIKLDEDENVWVWVNTSEMGQGSSTVLAQIVAEVLTLPLERVKVSQPDSFLSPFADGGFSSRQTYNDGNAVRLAALDVKRQVLIRAAEIFGARPDGLNLEDGSVFIKDTPNRKLRIRELFVRDQTRYGAFVPQGDLVGKATWHQRAGELDPETGRCSTDRAQAFYMSGAAGADIEVNAETGQVRVARMVLAVDVGKAINPLLVQSQIEGGAIMGLGSALYEELMADKSRIMNPNFVNYDVPSVLEAPEIKCIILEKPHPDGPFGAKGVAEIPTLGPSPAIGNAVAKALGVRIFDLPLTPPRILEALRAKGLKK